MATAVRLRKAPLSETFAIASANCISFGTQNFRLFPLFPRGIFSISNRALFPRTFKRENYRWFYDAWLYLFAGDSTISVIKLEQARDWATWWRHVIFVQRGQVVLQYSSSVSNPWQGRTHELRHLLSFFFLTACATLDEKAALLMKQDCWLDNWMEVWAGTKWNCLFVHQRAFCTRWKARAALPPAAWIHSVKTSSSKSLCLFFCDRLRVKPQLIALRTHRTQSTSQQSPCKQSNTLLNENVHTAGKQHQGFARKSDSASSVNWVWVWSHENRFSVACLANLNFCSVVLCLSIGCFSCVQRHSSCSFRPVLISLSWCPSWRLRESCFCCDVYNEHCQCCFKFIGHEFMNQHC